MRKNGTFFTALRLLVLAFCCQLAHVAEAKDCVVLLHGYLRGAGSMDELAEVIGQAGFTTVNSDYSSRADSLEALADTAVDAALKNCGPRDQVHFVTHSMGGILLRQYVATHPHQWLGRVVMLAPPNQGTTVVNRLLDIPGMAWVLGPAGSLGQGAGYLPARLPAVDFELGIIAGTVALNPFLMFLVDNPDDGTVSVKATEVDGMCSHLVLPVSHSLMMYDDDVIAQTLAFLQTGRFSLPQARNDLCRASTGAAQARIFPQ
jgi:pimeloyl-ACP methyl ester carboxylesterase